MAQHPDMGLVAGLGEGVAVRRSGFDPFRQRQAAPAMQRDEWEALARGNAMAVETGYREGRRRMATPRHAVGCAGGRPQARRLRRHGSAGAPNLLARQVAVDHPEQVWAGAIPSGWTAEGG
jgi:hypothetical protein